MEHQVRPDHLNFAILMSTIMIYLSVAFVLEYKDICIFNIWMVVIYNHH